MFFFVPVGGHICFKWPREPLEGDSELASLLKAPRSGDPAFRTPKNSPGVPEELLGSAPTRDLQCAAGALVCRAPRWPGLGAKMYTPLPACFEESQWYVCPNFRRQLGFGMFAGVFHVFKSM